MSHCQWSLLHEGLAHVGGWRPLLLSPVCVWPGLSVVWGCGRRNGEGERRQEGTRPGNALSCGSFSQGRLPSQQDGIRFPSAESSSQVYKSQPPPPLPSVFFSPLLSLFCFLGCRNPPSFFLSSLSLLPSFLSLACMSLNKGKGWQVDIRAVTVGWGQGRIKVRAQTIPTRGMGLGGSQCQPL